MVRTIFGNGTRTSSSNMGAAPVEGGLGLDGHVVEFDAVLVGDLVADHVGAADQRGDQSLGRGEAKIGAVALLGLVDHRFEIAHLEVGARMGGTGRRDVLPDGGPGPDCIQLRSPFVGLAGEAPYSIAVARGTGRPRPSYRPSPKDPARRA